VPTVRTITSGALTVQQPRDFTHFVGPVVVSFPSPDEAAAFFTASAERWPACSNRQYTFSQAGKSDVVWTVGPVTNTNGTLITTETQEGRQRLELRTSAKRTKQRRHRRHRMQQQPVGFGSQRRPPDAAKVP
jgi:hypothetical protein